MPRFRHERLSQFTQITDIPGNPKFVARAATVNFPPPLRRHCLQKPTFFETPQALIKQGNIV
jgi:hypothetical protein